MIVVCKNCNKNFITYKSRVNIGSGKFCSVKCRGYSMRGCIGHRKGIKFTHEQLERLSISHRGQIPWNKGIKLSGSHLENIRLSIIKRKKEGKLKAWNKGIVWKEMSGENHPNWKGGISDINKLDRSRFRKTIQKTVFERDDYTCQLCGIRGKDMTVDHIQPWAEYIELRFNISNCRTLCQSCHYEITYGKPMPPSVRAWGHNLSKGGAEL